MWHSQFVANLFHRSGISRCNIMSIMTATNQNTDPLQKQKIYGVSIASMIESIIFLTLYSVIINVIRYEIGYHRPWSLDRLALESSLNTCAIMIAAYALRFLVALALLKKRYKTTIIFYVATIVGIIINLVTGLMAISSQNTHAIGVATLCVIGLHIAYIILMHGVIQKMREELMGDILNLPLPGHSPYGRPMRTAIFTVPQGQNIHNGYIHGPLPPPYTTHSSDPNLDPYSTQSYPQAPPSYGVQFENGPDGPRKVVVMNS